MEDLIRLNGRALYLSQDPAIVRAQLAGEADDARGGRSAAR